MKHKQHMQIAIACILSAVMVTSGAGMVALAAEEGGETITVKSLSYAIDEANETAEIVGHTFTDEMLSKNFSISIPDTVTVGDREYRVVSIGEGAFQGLGQTLSERQWAFFSWGSNLERIGAYAFDNCNFEVGFLRIPASVTEVGEYAFRNWKANQLNLQDCTRLTSLPQGVFSGLQSGGIVELAPGLTYIHPDAFAGASPIKKLTVYGTEELIKDCAVLNGASNITYIDPYAKDDAWLREQVAAAPEDTPATIVVEGGIDITETVVIPAGKHITLVDDGKPHTIKNPSSNGNSLFQVEKGASLTVTTSTGEDRLLLLQNQYPDFTSGSIATVAGGTFRLEHGTLRGGNIYQGRTAAVWVEKGGGFTMTGGVIEGMRLDGGAVSGSLALNAPVVINSGSFDMSGGEIRDNHFSSGKASNCSGGVLLSGWSPSDDPAVMKLSGSAKITGNSSGEGGGITLVGKAHLTMEGGFVTDNTGGYGGGICVAGKSGGTGDDCRFTMHGGEISGNSASNAGGGIYLNSSGVILQGGRIQNNSARQGGGVYVSEPPHEVEIYNAVITGNEASVMGGGLWFCPTGDAAFAVTNGVAVYGNTAAGAGDDFVALRGTEGSVTLADRLLGGGAVEWYRDGGVIGGSAVSGIPPQNVLGQIDETIPRFDPAAPGNRLTEVSGSDNYALKAVVSDNAIKLAQAQTKLYITGNHAQRGGGIGANGAAMLGEQGRDYALRVIKEWSAGTPEEKKTEVTVSLRIGDVVLDPIKLNRENNWTAAFTQLPDPVSLDGAVYTVTESAVDGFTTTYSEAVADTQTHTLTITLTNTYRPAGSLGVRKTVSGSAGSRTKDFRFTVTLEDKTISGTFGDMEFKEGVADFTLRHGQSRTAEGLPVGLGYTVTESGAGGYTTTSSGAAGTLAEGQTVWAEFRNHKDGGGRPPETGDPTPLAWYLSMAGGSGVGLTALAAAARRRKRKKAGRPPLA